MWLDSETVSGTRLLASRRRARRRTTLRVTARMSRDRRAAVRWGIGAAIAAPLLAGVSVLLWFGLRAAGRGAFARNPRFVIQRLEIEAGEVMHAGLVKEFTRIDVGTNLFAVNTGELRKAFLARAPNVQSIRFYRFLPDRMRIEITERVPLARVGRLGHLVASGDGHVFGLRAGLSRLPILSGYPGARLRPGNRLSGAARAAVQVLAACEDPELGIRIREIDVSRTDYLMVFLEGHGGVRRMDLNWDGMGSETRASRAAMTERLRWASQVLHSEKGRRQSRLDATYADMIVGQP